MDTLSEKCQKMLSGKFTPKLEAAIKSELGVKSSEDTWKIEVDPVENEGKTLLFHYPKGVPAGSESGYVPQRVKLEFGARGA